MRACSSSRSSPARSASWSASTSRRRSAWDRSATSPAAGWPPIRRSAGRSSSAPRPASPRPSGRCPRSSSCAIGPSSRTRTSSGPGSSPSRAAPTCCGGSRRSCAGPTSRASRREVDALARSLTFDDLPAPLDEADRDVALGTAIDSVDRAMRQYPGRRFLDCIPRVPGTVEATIDDGPRGRLTEPLAVTCTTTVTTSDLRAWQADLEVAWPATDDHEAGAGRVGSCSTPRAPSRWRPTSPRGPARRWPSPAIRARDGPDEVALLRAG